MTVDIHRAIKTKREGVNIYEEGGTMQLRGIYIKRERGNELGRGIGRYVYRKRTFKKYIRRKKEELGV